MKPERLTTNRKALTINLDSEIYGTFAEIGAGQEVAGHFFKAGGAAGTIAKSISAYDMKFSDAIYGKCDRYVSKGRMQQMLDHEYRLLLERLGESRGEESCFFVFADTVAARNFHGTNECHGWMGVRFQREPGDEPCEIILHVRMLDKTNIAQQEALGIIGVNLVYGAFIYRDAPETFIESLADNLGTDRIEVDMLEFNGPGFEDIDNRILSLNLVRQGLTNAVMFGPGKEVLQPSEALYKKAVLVERGSFRPVTHVNIDMLEAAGSQFVQEPRVMGEEVTVLFEITMNNLLSTGVDLNDFIARVETIEALGYHVLISNYPEYYRLSQYFRRYTKKMIGLVLGINHMLAIFDDNYYQNLEGGILESCGRLFKDNVKLYVYPMKADSYNRYCKADDLEGGTAIEATEAPEGFASEMLITADNLQIKTHLRSLYAYLKENHYIEAIRGYNQAHLNIFSRNILQKIRDDEEGWQEAVPEIVGKMIKERGLFQGSDKNGKEEPEAVGSN